MHSNFKQELQQPRDYQPLIVVVDNDHDNLLFASCVIESLGMRYVVTDDSGECLGLVSKLLPDIILLDIVMPKLDGLEITRLIRKDKNVSHIPIIAVTGLTQAKDRTKLVEAGCDAYLSKPYLIEELESKIHSCLKCNLRNRVVISFPFMNIN